MRVIIRKIKNNELALLKNFLYEAIWIPKDVDPPPRSVVELPELRLYYEGFGSQKHDRGFATEVDGVAVGAAWARIMNDYGHVDDNTPSLAIAITEEYRGMGIGSMLLNRLFEELRALGCLRVSLSVSKENERAVGLYLKLSFESVDSTALSGRNLEGFSDNNENIKNDFDDYLMVKNL